MAPRARRHRLGRLPVRRCAAATPSSTTSPRPRRCGTAAAPPPPSPGSPTSTARRDRHRTRPAHRPASPTSRRPPCRSPPTVVAARPPHGPPRPRHTLGADAAPRPGRGARRTARRGAPGRGLQRSGLGRAAERDVGEEGLGDLHRPRHGREGHAAGVGPGGPRRPERRDDPAQPRVRGEVPQRHHQADLEELHRPQDHPEAGAVRHAPARRGGGQPGLPRHGVLREGGDAAPRWTATPRSTAGRTATPPRCSTSTGSATTPAASGPGQLYGLSQMGEYVGVYYNKTVLATLGIAAADHLDGAGAPPWPRSSAPARCPIQFGNLDKWPAIHTFGVLQAQHAGEQAVRDLVYGSRGREVDRRPRRWRPRRRCRTGPKKGYFPSGRQRHRLRRLRQASSARATGRSSSPAPGPRPTSRGRWAPRSGSWCRRRPTAAPATTGGQSLALGITTGSEHADVAAAYIDFLTDAHADDVMLEQRQPAGRAGPEGRPRGRLAVESQMVTGWTDGQPGRRPGALPGLLDADLLRHPDRRPAGAHRAARPRRPSSSAGCRPTPTRSTADPVATTTRTTGTARSQPTARTRHGLRARYRRRSPGEPRAVGYLYVLPAAAGVRPARAGAAGADRLLLLLRLGRAVGGHPGGTVQLHRAVHRPRRCGRRSSTPWCCWCSTALLPILIGLLLAATLSRVRVRGLTFFRTVLFLPAGAGHGRRRGDVALGLRPRRRAQRGAAAGRPGRRWPGPGWATSTWRCRRSGVAGTWVGFGLCMVLFVAGVQSIPTRALRGGPARRAGPGGGVPRRDPAGAAAPGGGGGAR